MTWKARAQDLVKMNKKGVTVEQLGAHYGSYCAAWEDGACKNEPCTELGGPGHTCGTQKECKALWGKDHDFNSAQPWCCDAWCYVDPNTCTEEIQERYNLDVQKSWIG